MKTILCTILCFLCFLNMPIFCSTKNKNIPTEIQFAESFLDRFSSEQPITLSDESVFFIPFGGYLGESLYVDLGFVKNLKWIKKDLKYSYIGELIRLKLKKIFPASSRMTYYLSQPPIYREQSGELDAMGMNLGKTYVFIKITSSEQNYFDCSLMVSLCITNFNGKLKVDLLSSYINNKTFGEFIGFQKRDVKKYGWSGCWKLPQNELQILENHIMHLENNQ